MPHPPCPTCGGEIVSEQRTFGAVLRCQQCGAVRSTLHVAQWGNYSPPEHQRQGAETPDVELGIARVRRDLAARLHGDVAALRTTPDEDAPFIRKTGFCRACYGSTTNESPGSTFTVNLVFGTRLMGGSEQCPACGSMIQWLWFWFFLPIIPLGRYRIKYLSDGLLRSTYIGRKLRS